MKALFWGMVVFSLGALVSFKNVLLPAQFSTSTIVTIAIWMMLIVSYIYFEINRKNLTIERLEYDLYSCLNFVFPFLKKHYEHDAIYKAYQAFSNIIKQQEELGTWHPNVVESDNKKLKWELSCQWKDVMNYARWTNSVPMLVDIMNAEQIYVSNYDVFTQALLCFEECHANEWGYGHTYGRENLPGLKITAYPGRELGPQRI